MTIGTRIVQAAAAAASQPQTRVGVNGPEKITGGGATVNWQGPGNMLTATAPDGAAGWAASAKDHLDADPADLVAYAIALNDASDAYEVVVSETTSPVASHPKAVATAPAGFVMVGGGCRVNWETDPAAAGSLLTASFPSSANTWECRAKDHEAASPASVTAYAVAIRPRGPGTPTPRVRIDEATGPAAAHPQAEVRPAQAGHIVTGGGARTNADYANGAAGQLLTRSAPLDDGLSGPVGWTAAAKDHLVGSPGSLTAFVLSADLAPTGAAVGIDEYVRTIPALPRASSTRAAEREEDLDIGGIVYKLRRQAVTLINNTSDLKLFEEIPGDAIWPGAILRARSIDDTTFRSIGLPRAPGRIFVDGVVAGNPGQREAVVANPDFASASQAVLDRLTALAPTGSAGSSIYESATASRLDEGLVKLGVSFKPAAFSIDVKASFDSSHKTNTAIIQVMRKFYSVVFLPGVGGPGAFFAPGVSLNDVRQAFGPDDPPVYISMVHYGQLLHVIIDSQESKTEFNASVDATITALNGGASLSGRQKTIMEASRVRIIEKGGAGGSLQALAGAGTLVERINNRVAAGAGFSLANPGVPIAIELRYLGSRDPFRTALVANYDDALSLGAPDVSGSLEITDGWRPAGGPKDTGVLVGKGDRIVVSAEGTNWSGHLGTRVYDANGHPQEWFIGDDLDTTGFPIPDANPFCLIAGFDGREWVMAGRRARITANYDGAGPRRLWFGTNDSNPYDGDNARRFTVNYTVVRKTAAEMGYNGLGRS